MRLLAPLTALLVLIASPASAQWLYHFEDDPFRGNQHMAMTMSATTGVIGGFRCISRDDVTLMLILPEKPDPATLNIMQFMPAKLLVIVDDAKKIELPAKIETTPDGGRYRIASTGQEVLPILMAAASARRRFALAAEVGGDLSPGSSFGVSGSSGTIGKLIHNCKLNQPAS